MEKTPVRVASTAGTISEDAAIRYAVEVAQSCAYLDEHCCAYQDFTGNTSLTTILDDARRLSGPLRLLEKSLSDESLRHQLDRLHVDAVSYAGEWAPSYLQVVFCLGERRYMPIAMLCEHGVLFEYTFRSRLNAAELNQFKKPWPPIPGRRDIKFDSGHGGCLRSSTMLLDSICREIGQLPSIDANHVREFLAKEGSRIKTSPMPDGPFGINEWRHAGRNVPGRMTAKPHRLASYLFERLGRKVAIGDLVGKDCIFENVNDSSVQRHGSTISNWFVKRDVPLIVSSGDGFIWMERM